METRHSSGIGDYIDILRRRAVYPAIIVPAVLFICLLAAFGITPRYRASATIMLEMSSVPKDFIETTVTSYADQQIEIVQGRVMTVDSLRNIVQQVDPYPGQKSWSETDKAQRILDDTTLERVDPVTLKPQTESNAFSLHYNNPKPALAAAVDARLAQLFLSYNQRVRTEAAQETAGFLQKQSEQLVQQMRQVDAQVADMKRQHGEALPEFLMRNQADSEEAQHELDTLQQQILAAQDKETLLTVQLSQISPNLIAQSGDLTDVATVRAKLTEAEQRYTPDHPEVKRLRHALETLVEQQTSASKGGKIEANNPQYQMLEAQIRGARATIANLQAQYAATKRKLERSEALVAQTPLSEKAMSDILRRKDVLQTEYQHIQDRLQNANLAETFESHQGGERFTLVRAPSIPHLPVYPNRIGLILLGTVFGFAIAGIAVAIAESTDTRLRAERDIALPEGVVVLANIPFINNSVDRRRRAIMLSSFAASYLAAIIAVVAMVVSSRHR